jgi:hypothetical protein
VSLRLLLRRSNCNGWLAYASVPNVVNPRKVVRCYGADFKIVTRSRAAHTANIGDRVTPTSASAEHSKWSSRQAEDEKE